MNDFFLRDTFFIDQKAWSVGEFFRIFDEEGKQIGSIKESLPALNFIFSLIVPKDKLPFTIQLKDEADNVLATVDKKLFTFSRKVDIKNSDDNKIGAIKRKDFLFETSYNIYGPDDSIIGTIVNDVYSSDIKVTDNEQKNLATIHRKWDNSMSQIFCDADQYKLTVSSRVSDPDLRMVIITAASVIDGIRRRMPSWKSRKTTLADSQANMKALKTFIELILKIIKQLSSK
ncbi:MAG: hypothetical protein J6Y37_03445 [Paludibacteraceae bacterium]|nr:hypothetical protein [Paludibacteraceae bacterium]